MINIAHFIQGYDGYPIRVVAAGAGISLSQICTYPGASKVIDGVLIPYSNQSMENMIGKVEKVVSKETIEKFFELYDDTSVLQVCITGALTTNRYRKGDNHAYIGLISPTRKDIYYVTLEKAPEELYNNFTPGQLIKLRQYEDNLISYITLILATTPGLDFVQYLKNECPLLKDVVKC